MRHRLLIRSFALGRLAGLAGLGLCLITGCSGGQPALSPAPGKPAINPLAGTLPTQASPTVPDSSLAGIHACKLVPASVVSQVLGPLLERPAETSNGKDCFYNTEISAGNGGPSYILSVTTRSGYEAAKAFAEGVAESDSKAERFAITHDLGDDAFSIATDTGGPDYSLWAAKAGRAVEVNVNDLGKGVPRAHDLIATALRGL